MRSEVISEQQGVAAVTLFVLGSAIILGLGTQAGENAWLAVMIGLMAAVPLVTIYARLQQLLPGYDFFDVLCFALGSFLGRLVGVGYVWFAFHLGALVLRNFGEFFITVGLVETPQVLPISVMALLCLWAAKEGLELLGRWSNLFVTVILVLIGVVVLLLTTEWDMNNLRPLLYEGWAPVLMGAFHVFTFPFAETVIFSMSFSFFQEGDSPYRVYLGGLLLGGAALLIVTINELAVLGPNAYSDAYFPAYQAISRLNIRDFIQRIEMSAAITFLIGGFAKISFCLLAACRGIAKILHFDDYRFIVGPTTLLMVSFAILVYDSIMEMVRWATEVWPLYAFPFQVVIPVVVWIICEVKVRLRKPQNKKIHSQQAKS